jgi:hypothetical protein
VCSGVLQEGAEYVKSEAWGAEGECVCCMCVCMCKGMGNL